MSSFVARISRGEGCFIPERIPYFYEQAVPALSDIDLMLTVNSEAPVAFYAYPNSGSLLLSPHTNVRTLSTAEHNPAQALKALADALGAPAKGMVAPTSRPALNRAKFNPHSIGAVLAAHLPVGAIISEDAPTSGLQVFSQTTSARRHEYLMLTGGAIGQGMPVAIGAAIASPGSKVVCLSGDGAGAYTPQALWTMKREHLDIATIIFANRSYKILNMELDRSVLPKHGPIAQSLLGLTSPKLDWVAIAKGFGVDAVSCTSVDEFEAAFQAWLAGSGPFLIEAVIG